jgi:endonuclease YncB( thermonuclease family)
LRAGRGVYFVDASRAAIVTEGFKLTGRNTLLGYLRLAMPWLSLVVAAGTGATEAYSARASIVSDGDTLWVQPDTGGAPRKLRLQGLDAPEICQTGGVASRDALRVLVMHHTLKVRVQYFDNYGRGLARIEAAGQDVAAAMVRQGQAWSYRWRHNLGPYAELEAQARRARIGLFAGSTPELPRDFRQRHGNCYAPDSDGRFKLK